MKKVILGFTIFTALSGCMEAEKVSYDTNSSSGLFVSFVAGSIGSSVDSTGSTGNVNPACSSTASATHRFTNSTMAGCGGSVAYTQRATLCGAGAHVCSAGEYRSRRGTDIPAAHFWVEDALNFGGVGDNGNCMVTMQPVGSVIAGNTISSCTPGQYTSPMRVCATGVGTTPYTDLYNNACNWIHCGYEDVNVNEYFGGCNDNLTAGTLCCL